MNNIFKIISSLVLIILFSGCSPVYAPNSPRNKMEPPVESLQASSTTPEINDELAIRETLSAHLGANMNDLAVIISENTGSYARGGVENGYFLAAKINGQWLIVADGQGALDCQIVTQYGFPASMVPECSGTPYTPSDEELLKTALAAHLGADVNALTITISQNTGSHARGGVDNGYFLAAKINGQWLIVADGQGALDCQVVYQYGFPTNMIPECSGTTNTPSDEDLIKAAIAAHLGANVNTLSITISQNTGLYAKGGVENGYFLAAKVSGQWLIVADGQGAIDCNVVAQYGFPAYMVPECSSTSNIPTNTIKFKPGGTFTYVQKTIKAGEQHTYSVNALAGQTMIVGVSSENNDVFVGVKGLQGGQQLVLNSSHLTSWTGTLPQTQTYLITVTTNNPGTVYFLNVEIPANVRFETGTYSATVTGHIETFEDTPSISVNNHVTYLVRASAGQTMDVKLFSPNIDALSLGVYGQDDGQPYLRYEVKNEGYHGVVPATQGYYLKVFSFKKSTDFTLEITIL
jgi:SpoU rRNA methylase family enzyme